MVDVTITPNMNLPTPVPSVAPGPEWASNIVADMYAIDSHDHSAGKGVPITPDGLNITADLPMGENNLTDTRTVRFISQSAPLGLPADLLEIYAVDADLYYNDGAGNQVRITQGGVVTGATGTITGLPSGTASASFAAGTFTFQSATNTPATMSVGPLVIGRQVSGSPTVTLAPNAGQVSNFNVNFPAALPLSTNFVTLDNSGNLSFDAAGFTGTGAVVLATSATLTTPTLTSPTITGATLTGITQAPAGSAAAPSYTFTGDTDTGLYSPGANRVGITTNGILRRTVLTTEETFTLQQRGPTGAESNPTYSFSGDTTTGVYDGGNSVAFSTLGTRRGYFQSTGLVVDTAGTAAAPSIAWDGDPDTGIYHDGANVLRFATAGSQKLAIVAGGLSTPAGIGVESGGGGFLQWRVFTGTLAGGASTSLATGGTVIGASGYSTFAGSGTLWQPISNGIDGAASTVNIIKWRTGVNAGSTSDVNIENYDTDSTNSYRVVVYYQ